MMRCWAQAWSLLRPCTTGGKNDCGTCKVNKGKEIDMIRCRDAVRGLRGQGLMTPIGWMKYAERMLGHAEETCFCNNKKTICVLKSPSWLNVRQPPAQKAGQLYISSEKGIPALDRARRGGQLWSFHS
ncbi:hypothetical protein BJV78DRAFT_104693 [Lactifluus subvellereus]|nr:hypothetical protein BJV78DRAFT_104693 [Lactifluus subvellereus]